VFTALGEIIFLNKILNKHVSKLVNIESKWESNHKNGIEILKSLSSNNKNGILSVIVQCKHCNMLSLNFIKFYLVTKCFDKPQIQRTNSHMNWLLHSLKVFGMCWRRLYRVLDSCIDNTRS